MESVSKDLSCSIEISRDVVISGPSQGVGFIKFWGKSLEKIILLTRKWISVILILFTLNAFSLNLGYGSPVFFRLCGFLSLMVLVLLYGNLYIKILDKKESVFGMGLILFSLITILYPLNPEFWLIGLPIFVCGFDILLRSANYHENHLSPLVLGCLIYVIFYIFYINVPALWLGIRSLSQWSSGIVGRMAGISLNIGSIISGTLILLTFVSCTIAFFILSTKKGSKDWRIFSASLVGLILFHAGYMLVLTTTWMTGEKAMDSLYLLFIILLIPFISSIARFRVSSIDLGTLAPTRKQGLAFVAIFLSVTLISIFPYFNGAHAGKVIIYERDSEMGFDVPQFPRLNESFEPDRGFSVGAIRLYLENIGYKVEGLNATNPHTLRDALSDADILLMLNIKKPFQYSELESIMNFVKNGGGLLIFGDHTSMFVTNQDFISGRDYLSEVLGPTGIRVNPDTADFVNSHWKYASLPLPHYVTKDLGFEITTSSVGASLNLTGTARPVIIGRYAFSDRANLTAPGYLGNRKFEKGEALGDLVVAASDTYGQGKVLVFGDTSYIFNTVLPFNYKLIYDSVAWLMSYESIYAAAFAWLSFIVLTMLVAYITIKVPQPKVNVLFLASIAIIIAFSLVVSGSINESLIQDSQKTEKDIAWIDHSHLNQFNLEEYAANGIAGLITNLFRNGYLPQVIGYKEDFPDVSKGKVLIIIAPNEHYTSEETSRLRKFVEGGGLLIISSGPKSTGPLDSILKSFDMQIGDLPLGAPPWIVETHGTMGKATVSPENLEKYWHKPKFMEAFPVWTSGEHTPIVWLNYGGANYNLIISKKFGQGEVVLIGDSRFLLNENLEYLSLGPGAETKEQYQLQWLGNIQLLREMLTMHKERG